MKPTTVLRRSGVATVTALGAALAFGAATDVSAEGYKNQGAQQQSSSQSMGAQPSQSMQQHSQAQVREVQQKLQQEGFDVGSIDGVWGPQTSSALRQFQQAEGIQASGELNAQTLSALDIDASSNSTVGGALSAPEGESEKPRSP